MEVLAIIPARGGSKGIPRKNIKKVNGRPLVDYTVDFSLKSKTITRTIVSSEDLQIIDHCRSIGSEVVVRPLELAGDESPTEDAICHVLTYLEAKEKYKPEVIVLLQPTSPLREHYDIDNSIAMIKSGRFNAAMSVTLVDAHYHPYWVKSIDKNSGELISPFGRKNKSSRINEIDMYYQRQQLPEKFYWKNGSIYAFTYESFKRLGHRYGDRCAPVVIPQCRTINIDTLDDMNKFERYLEVKCVKQ